MISVVIPAYNEEDIIQNTVREIATVMNQSDFKPIEIIVIDDGSTDNTIKKAEQEGAIIVKHPHNIGYGRSLKSGIMAASYDTILIIDADGTYPPEAIPALINQFQNGYDMVVGARQGEHYDESFLKKCLRIFLKSMVEFTTGRNIPDINSGLRVFSKKTILSYISKLCDTFSFTTSLTLAYMMTGKFVTYVPINYYKRSGKTKVRLFRDSLRTMQFIVEAIIYYNPLKIFILFSAFLFLLSLFSFLTSYFFSILAGYIVCIGSFLISILIFGIGLLAVLLKQIMNERQT